MGEGFRESATIAGRRATGARFLAIESGGTLSVDASRKRDILDKRLAAASTRRSRDVEGHDRSPRRPEHESPLRTERRYGSGRNPSMTQRCVVMLPAL